MKVTPLLANCQNHLPAQYLADASVGNLQDPGNVTGPGPGVGQLHDPLPGGVGQRAATHEDATQLVDAAVA